MFTRRLLSLLKEMKFKLVWFHNWDESHYSSKFVLLVSWGKNKKFKRLTTNQKKKTKPGTEPTKHEVYIFFLYNNINILGHADLYRINGIKQLCNIILSIPSRHVKLPKTQVALGSRNIFVKYHYQTKLLTI